ncbi:unnamed protein product [Blepharisma stoltei]|uniref:Uncharacterized protein n=1 Tax=Blepharisma stoltei TaxID=1481888 RepID=A0AAU9IHZ3_9CILI|nr:unnamed protein product [Blepharisma stoltei]
MPSPKNEPGSQRFLSFKMTRLRIPPKKKHLWLKLIKGHQKIIHKISKRIFKIKNTSEVIICNRLEAHFWENKDILEEYQTKSGPINGKLAQKSLNEALKKYFQHEATKVSFYYYIELIFLELDPETLRKKFRFECCELRDHRVFCTEKWTELKNYLQRTMFTDIGIPLWIPINEAPPTISANESKNSMDYFP